MKYALIKDNSVIRGDAVCYRFRLVEDHTEIIKRDNCGQIKSEFTLGWNGKHYVLSGAKTYGDIWMSGSVYVSNGEMK